jgi:peroxiredoxin
MEVIGQNHTWRRRLAGGLAAGVVLWSAAGAPAAARDLKAGDKLPAVALRDLNGKPFSLAGFKNKAVWIALFHSTWGACNAEAPRLQKVYQQIQKRGGVVLGIAPREDEVASLKQFKTRNKVRYPIVIDQSGRIYETLPLGFPAAVLVDTKGVIRAAHGIGSEKEFAATRARFVGLLPKAGAVKKPPAMKKPRSRSRR